jgi:hypothetical protein
MYSGMVQSLDSCDVAAENVQLVSGFPERAFCARVTWNNSPQPGYSNRKLTGNEFRRVVWHDTPEMFTTGVGLSDRRQAPNPNACGVLSITHLDLDTN